MKTATYNPDRPSPGARALRRHLFKIWGGDPVLMEQRDNAEMQLFEVSDKIKELQDQADHLRGKIARLDALPSNKNPVVPLVERITEGRKPAHLEGSAKE